MDTKTNAGQALEVLIQKYPDKSDWLVRCLRSSERKYRQNTWTPLTPHQVLEIIRVSKETKEIQIEKSPIRISTLFWLQVFVIALSQIVPNLIDYEKNPALIFLKNNQALVFIILFVTIVITILFDRLRQVE